MIIHTVGDTKPSWIFRLRKRGGVYDLSEVAGAAVSVVVTFSDDTTLTKAAAILDAATGLCWVETWGATDLDVPGAATADVVLTGSGGFEQHAREVFEVYIRAEGELVEP